MYEKNLVAQQSSEQNSSSDVNKTTNIHNIYNVEKKTSRSEFDSSELTASQIRELSALREAYSLDDLPRVTRLNDQEVQSIDSALLSAEEQDLIDSSMEDERLSAQRQRYMMAQHGGYYPTIGDDPYGGRRVNAARRVTAVSAARRMAHANRGYHSDSQSLRSDRFGERSASAFGERHGDRYIHVVGGGSEVGTLPTTPSTLRRQVSAFGEITVMPVGDNEDEDLKIDVEERITRE